MSSLSTGSVNVALPVLQRVFGSNIANVTWVVTIFSLILSGALLGFGRLGDLRGNRSVYVKGCLLFAVSSGLCGLAPTLEVLIGFRALEAVGAAMILANETGILTNFYPTNRRGMVLGLQSTMTYVGLAAGPALGGLIITWLGWRWVFLINLPIGLLLLVLALRIIPSDTIRQSAESFDLKGTLIFIAALGAILLALNQGYTWGWFSPTILSLFVLSLGLFGLFIVVESRSPCPMLDLTLLQRSAFTSATIGSVLNNICVSAVLFVLPFLLIQGFNQTPALVGSLLAIRSLVMAGIAPFSGGLSDRVGTKPLRVVGPIVLTVGVLLLADDMGGSVLIVAIALAVIGLGNGIFIPPNNSALMGSAPTNRQGIAGGVLAAARNIGMAFGVGLAGAVFASITGSGHATPIGSSLLHATEISLLVSALASAICALAPVWEHFGDKQSIAEKSFRP